LSVAEVAEQVGVSTASIYFWERDHCRPRDENLSALCKVLKLPVRATKEMAAGWSGPATGERNVWFRQPCLAQAPYRYAGIADSTWTVCDNHRRDKSDAPVGRAATAADQNAGISRCVPVQSRAGVPCSVGTYYPVGAYWFVLRASFGATWRVHKQGAITIRPSGKP
jgi:hypothetical protein